MNRHSRVATKLFACLILAIIAHPSVGHAGWGDALKKKVADKVSKKAEDAVDKTGQSTQPSSSEDTEAPVVKDPAAKPADGAGGSPAKVSTVSTKFDFVPGDRVLFLDDFDQDELGEFPVRWKLVQGTFEVAELEGERWLRCVSPDGRIRMKLPASDSLPEFWTLEFDFFGEEPLSSALTVRGLGKGDQPAWEVTYPHSNGMFFRSGDIFGSTPLESPATVGGRHHVMLMARGTALKAYMDRQRMVSIPDVSAPAGMPTEFEIRLWSPTRPMIAHVRFAEGCRPAKDLLDQGKLVTYGIHFATGSDVVMPESAPVLRQVSTYLEAHPAVKLQITGHTDNVGTAASNLELSKRRAAAVAKVLSEQFGIAVERFASDGKGDTQTVASNAKPEGRAMNRRVEFAKR